MINTFICFVLSFLLSAVTASLLTASTPILMVVKLLVAVGLVITFIRAVVHHGRKPMWIVIGLIGLITVILLLLYLAGWTLFEAGYIPFLVGEVLAMNVAVVGELAYQLRRKTNPSRSLFITTTVTLTGLLLGWSIFFWFLFGFKDA